MKRILVTGANGQLGTAIKKRARNFDQFAFTFVDIHDIDLTDEKKVNLFFDQMQIDYIINCAAFTAVDQAEHEPDTAFLVNAGIPSLLGKLCRERMIYIIQLSTDYIYDGKSHLPHREDEDPLTVSVYAQSKLEGERELWGNPRAIVIRTSWMYSEFGNNFLMTMIRLSKEKPEVKVVYDQVGTPTYAGDLANVLLRIIAYSENKVFRAGIYNYSSEGVCSWYDFAVEIMQLTKKNCTVVPIRTDEYPRDAKRPAYSVMDKSKIKNTFGITIDHWKNGLITALKNLELNGF